MRLIVCAAPRRPPNWHTTLAAAWKADPRSASWPTIVCLDSPESEQVSLEREAYAHLGVEIVALTEEEHRRHECLSPESRAYINNVRCLRNALDEACVIVEDDITFSRGWADKAESISTQRDAVYLGYCREPLQGVAWIQEAVEWDATLFVAWAPGMTEMAADGLLRLWDKHIPADNALTTWWREHGTRRYTLVPSIVQHLGDDALINSGHGKRRSPIWEP